MRIITCCVSFAPLSIMRRLNNNQTSLQSTLPLSLSLPPKGSITPISKPYRGNVSGQDIITHHWKRRPNQIKRIRRSKWATKVLHERFIHFRDCRTVLQERWIKDKMRLSKMITQILCNSRLPFRDGSISRVPTTKCYDHSQWISASAHLFGLCEWNSPWWGSLSRWKHSDHTQVWWSHGVESLIEWIVTCLILNTVKLMMAPLQSMQFITSYSLQMFLSPSIHTDLIIN